MTNDILKGLAEAYGACAEKGLALIEKAKNADDWIDILMSPQGIEFCMEKQFPPLGVLTEYKEKLSANNVFFDGVNELVNPRLVIVFGGTVSIILTDHNVCEVFATNEAHVNITAKDNSYASIELHHDSSVNVLEQGGKIRRFQK